LFLTAGLGIASEVPLVAQNGVYTVPVRINDAMTVNFIVDSGASEVQIPADVAQILLRKGALQERDFMQDRIYTMADGSQVKSERVLIKRLRIGDRVVEGVTASIGNVHSAPLIGQSLLYRFPTWSLDNRRHLLILGDEAAPSVSGAARSRRAARGVSGSDTTALKGVTPGTRNCSGCFVDRPTPRGCWIARRHGKR
jgi:clan AA aspartic protease (TIGR02281 family)